MFPRPAGAQFKPPSSATFQCHPSDTSYMSPVLLFLVTDPQFQLHVHNVVDLGLEKQFLDVLITRTLLPIQKISTYPYEILYVEATAGYCRGEMGCRTNPSNVSVPIFISQKCFDLEIEVSLSLAIIIPTWSMYIYLSTYLLFRKAQYFLFALGTGIYYPTMFCLTENYSRPHISNGLVNQMFCTDNI